MTDIFHAAAALNAGTPMVSAIGMAIALGVESNIDETFVKGEAMMTPIDARDFKRQKCGVCKCQDKFNFHVPDKLWRQVVPKEYWSKVVCLQCFDEFARTKEINYAQSIETLYFAGNQATFKFQTVSSQSA